MLQKWSKTTPLDLRTCGGWKWRDGKIYSMQIVTTANKHAPNIRVPKYIKKTLTNLEGKIQWFYNYSTLQWPTFICGHNIQTENQKETAVLNNSIDQMGLTDNPYIQNIYRTLYPRAAEYTFISSAHATFSRLNHMLVPEINLIKFKKTEIILNIIF